MHIVVARYNESLEWLDELSQGTTYTIYNKGEDDLSQLNIKVPNAGRESETYLRYILEHYNELPETICFCQGKPHPHHVNFMHVLSTYSKKLQPKWRKEIFPLGLPIISQLEMPDKTLHGMPIGSFINESMPGYENVESIEWVYGAQYIVDRGCITNKSYKWWEKMYTLHEKYGSEIPLVGSPWLFERVWLLIWNYNEEI